MQAYIAYLFYYPAFCGFDKIDDVHNFLCHGQFPFYLRQAFLSQLAALVKYAVSIVDVLDCFVREAAPAQTNYVYALISGRFACHKHVRRYVLTEACAATYHYVSAYVAELVHKHHSTYVCKVVNDYFACYLGRVAYDTVAAYRYIVCHVAVFHKQVVRPYYGPSFCRRAAVDCHVFAYLVVIAYYCGGLLAFELEVLRYGAYYRAGEEYVAAAYARSAKDRNAVHKYVVVAYFDVFVDVAESSYLTVFSDFRFGVDVCQRTYLAHFISVGMCATSQKCATMLIYLFFTICAVNVASQTIFSPTNTKPFIEDIPWRTGARSSTLNTRVSPGTTF